VAYFDYYLAPFKEEDVSSLSLGQNPREFRGVLTVLDHLLHHLGNRRVPGRTAPTPVPRVHSECDQGTEPQGDVQHPGRHRTYETPDPLQRLYDPEHVQRLLLPIGENLGQLGEHPAHAQVGQEPEIQCNSIQVRPSISLPAIRSETTSS
jgi:hypothetical protein